MDFTRRVLMKKSLAILSLASIGLASLPAVADDYVIDTKGAHASINFSIKHLGYSYIVGRFNTFSGDFSYDPKSVATSTLNVSIDTTSIDSNHAERDKHLRSADFLNVEKFPTATFVSKKIIADDDADEFNIVGDLTLNG